MDAHVFSIVTQIRRTHHFYTVVADPGIESPEVQAFAKSLAEVQAGIIFTSSPVLDSKMRVLLGLKKEHDKQSLLPKFESAKSRKQRSMAVFEKQELKPSPTLPTIVADEQTKLRTAKATAQRAACLLAVAATAEGSEFDAKAFLKKHDLWKALSPDELEYLESDNAKRGNSVLTWRYESAWTLLWALGKTETLAFPDKQASAVVALKIMLDDPEAFLAKPELRDVNEILDQTDILYRAMWLCRDASLNHRRVESLNPRLFTNGCMHLTG